MANDQEIPDYNLMHAKWAASYVSIKKANVLVVGCNTGEDCRNLVELGARNVWGVDVVDGIGRDFLHPKVRYMQTSVESMDIPDNTFDLVFSFATMEHVPDIGKGFSEMARVTRPGGVIYSVAAPLWNSPYGHHKPDLFQPDHPWIHLLLDKESICALCERECIVPGDGKGIRHHVDYMLNPEFFNMTPTQRYIETCAGLEQFDVIRNDFDSLPASYLSSEIEMELAEKGYSREELLAVTHMFVGQKRGSNRQIIADGMGLQPAWKRYIPARSLLRGIKIKLSGK